RASITTTSESPALRSTDKSHESVGKRSLSCISVAISPGSGAPYSRTAEISRAMIAHFETGPLFDHPSLSLNASAYPPIHPPWWGRYLYGIISNSAPEALGGREGRWRLFGSLRRSYSVASDRGLRLRTSKVVRPLREPTRWPRFATE